MDEPSTAVKSLVGMAVFWIVGACLLVVSWRAAVAEDRIRKAPTCTESQLFTAAECQATVDGTMTSLTNHWAQMDIGGRHVVAPVRVAGRDFDVSGVSVRVLLYRGKPLHIEGRKIKIDTDGAPASRRANFLFMGMFFVIGGAVLAGANVLVASIRRKWATSAS